MVDNYFDNEVKTAEGRFKYQTNRPGEFALIAAGLKPKDLEGKTILNYGCGHTNMEETLRRLAINATVYSADLRIPFDNNASKPITIDLNRIISKQIPKVDIIIINYVWIGPTYEKSQTIQQLVEILKPNGEIYITPAEENEIPILKKAISFGADFSIVKGTVKDSSLDPETVTWASPNQKQILKSAINISTIKIKIPGKNSRSISN